MAGVSTDKPLVMELATDKFELSFPAQDGVGRIDLTMKAILPSEKGGGNSFVKAHLAGGAIHELTTSPLRSSDSKTALTCPAYVDSWPDCPNPEEFQVLVKRSKMRTENKKKKKTKRVLARATFVHPLVPYGDTSRFVRLSDHRAGGVFVADFYGKRNGDRAALTSLTFDPSVTTEEEFERLTASARAAQEAELASMDGKEEAKGLIMELQEEDYEDDVIRDTLGDILYNDQICISGTSLSADTNNAVDEREDLPSTITPPSPAFAPWFAK